MRRHGETGQLGLRARDADPRALSPHPDPLPEGEGVSLCPQHPALSTQHWIPALPTSTLLQIVLLVGIFLLNLFPGTDPDLWWHMATGRYIVETGTIPRVDPFSYTATGRPWVAHEWLAEVVLYLTYRSGGYLALVLLAGTAITLTFGIVLRTLRLLGLKPVAASCITFWVASMSLFGWNVRPQLFSYLLFTLYLYLLLRSRRQADRWLWLMPALMIPWANLHAGYVMGLVLVGLFLAGEGINRWRATGRRTPLSLWERVGVRARAPSTQHPALRTQDPASIPQDSALNTQHSALSTQHSLRRYLTVAVATVAATLFNPQGPAVLLYPFSYAGTQNASMKFITEWQSPNFHYYYFFVFGISLMALMVIPMRRPLDWALTIPLLALTAMSLQSVRVIPFYAIGVAPVLASRLGIAVSGQHSALSSQHSGLSTRSSLGTRWNWMVLGLCLATLASTLFLSDRTQWGPEPRTSEYPAAGVRYLRESGLQGKLFNTFHWGGFLIWSFYPERRVFVDGRPDMYGDGFMEDYGKVQDARPGWREVLDRYQVEVALVEKDGRVATLLAASGEWHELFRGEIESVLVRSPRQGEDRRDGPPASGD